MTLFILLVIIPKEGQENVCPYELSNWTRKVRHRFAFTSLLYEEIFEMKFISFILLKSNTWTVNSNCLYFIKNELLVCISLKASFILYTIAYNWVSNISCNTPQYQEMVANSLLSGFHSIYNGKAYLLTTCFFTFITKQILIDYGTQPPKYLNIFIQYTRIIRLGIYTLP